MNQEQFLKSPYTTPKLLVHGNMVSIVQNELGACDDNPGGPDTDFGYLHSDGICYSTPQ